jgi:hypothetical protein
MFAYERIVKNPTANCGALQEREPPNPKLRMRPLSPHQQADRYLVEIFIKGFSRFFAEISLIEHGKTIHFYLTQF